MIDLYPGAASIPIRSLRETETASEDAAEACLRRSKSGLLTSAASRPVNV